MATRGKVSFSVYGLLPSLVLAPSFSPGATTMNETLLFVYGLVAFLLAVGPLAIAAYLDWKEKKQWRI